MLFAGAFTATPENNLATEYVASRFSRLGLRPVTNDGSFFLRYNLITARADPTGSLEAARGPSTRKFFQGVDFYPHRFSGSGLAQGKLAFAGFGIVAPDQGRDDYKGLDVRGRVVLVLDHEPGETDPASPFDGVVASEHADPLRKAVEAERKGAVALLIVSDVHNHPNPENFEALAAAYWPASPPRIERYALQSRVEQVSIPVAQVSRSVAADLLQSVNDSLVALSRSVDAGGGAGAVAVDAVTVTLSLAVRCHIVLCSDHWPFLQYGVPGVWFHNGLHPDYHTANDRPEKIRYDKMEQIVRLVHQASWDLAQQEDRPKLAETFVRLQGR